MSRNKKNRQQVQNNKRRKLDRHESKVVEGNRQNIEDQRVNREEYKLDWFNPIEAQQEILYSMMEDSLTLVQGSSGCGKSTTVIYQALQDMKVGNYKRILFVKTPVESTNDSIGFLPSTAEDKLSVHFEATRGIFHQFMSKSKLEMEEKRERILFRIPNFIQGSTWDNTLIIIDEAQQISPEILKLIMERVGTDSKVVVMGDKKQRYANKKRQDGFTDFVNRVTSVDEEGRYSNVNTIGYIELSAKDNMRSELSKLVVSIYEDIE